MDLQKLAKYIQSIEEILNLSLEELKKQLTVTYKDIKYVPKFDNDFHKSFLEKLINPNPNLNVVYNKFYLNDTPITYFLTNTILTEDNIKEVLNKKEKGNG